MTNSALLQACKIGIFLFKNILLEYAETLKEFEMVWVLDGIAGVLKEKSGLRILTLSFNHRAVLLPTRGSPLWCCVAALLPVFEKPASEVLSWAVWQMLATPLLLTAGVQPSPAQNFSASLQQAARRS